MRHALLTMALVGALLSGCAGPYHHLLGTRALDRGEYADAVTELQRAIDADPTNVRYRTDWLQGREAAVRRLLASAAQHASLGRTNDAELDYRRVLVIDPGNAMAKQKLAAGERRRQAEDDAQAARERFDGGDLDAAARLVRRALEATPDLTAAIQLQREIGTKRAAQALELPSLSALYRKPISLEFRDTAIKTVFEALSRTTGISFALDRDVKGDQKTSVFLKQTMLDDAIDVILATNQLDKKILSPTSVLVYPKTPAKAKEYEDLIVRAFYLATAEAKQTAQLLKTTLKLKDVFVDDKLNMLVLRESPDTIALAEKLIALHDLDEPEVMLEVEVLEINRSRLLDLGIKWANQLTVAPLVATQSNGSSATGTSTLRLSELRHLDSDTLGITVPTATLSLRKEDGDANLLANPRIRVRDRQKAKIMIGDKVPVVTTTATPNGFLSENIQYLDVGLKLEVEPNIHLRDEVGLNVALEVSSLVTTVKTANGSQAYQIGTRSASSALRLRDGETQVLAGLISDEERSAGDRIPLLGDFPILGRLFGSQKDDHRKTEIVLSITPRLIRPLARREPAAEAFWSGSEANLRTSPLQLRASPAVGERAPATEPALDKPATATPAVVPATTPGPSLAASAPAVSPTAAGAPAAPVAAAAVRARWDGPVRGQVGQPLQLTLWLEADDALRAVPVQLGLDAARWEVVAVREGDYFNRTAQGSFTHQFDAATGRLHIGASSNDPAGASGTARLVTLELKPLQAGTAEITVLRLAPGGRGRAVAALNAPLVHRLEIAP